MKINSRVLRFVQQVFEKPFRATNGSGIVVDDEDFQMVRIS
jgi:hypothetical protein